MKLAGELGVWKGAMVVRHPFSAQLAGTINNEVDGFELKNFFEQYGEIKGIHESVEKWQQKFIEFYDISG